MAADGAAGGELGADRGAEAVPRTRHFRGHSASGRDEGFQHHRRHQQGPRRAHLRGRRLRHRRRSFRGRSRSHRGSGTIAGPILVLWLLLVLFAGAFVAQVAARIRLIAAGADRFTFDRPAVRLSRFLSDVILQRQTIRERPGTGLAHAFVFWGFVAFAGYTLVEFLYGLGIVDLTRTDVFRAYRIALVPFSVAVLAGIIVLL